MSLRGYKPKHKKALWTEAFPEQVHEKVVPGLMAPIVDILRSRLAKSEKRRTKIMSRLIPAKVRPKNAKKQRIITYRANGKRISRNVPIRRQSKKRQRESRIYRKLSAQFLLEHPFCGRCGVGAQCVHHFAGRRSNYLKVETWRASCLDCNQFAKEHPAAARVEDWLAPVGVYLT